MEKEEKSLEEFSKKYEELCKEYSVQIIGVPQWVQSKDMGDYRLAVVLQVAKVEKPA